MAIDLQIPRVWLVLTNFVVMIKWARAFFIVCLLLRHGVNSARLQTYLSASVMSALSLSFLELFNAMIGLTRSNTSQVLLFSGVRMGVWALVAPKIPPDSWQTLMTVACWSFGDTIRFGCFGMNTLFPGSRLAKDIRYTVAPVLFPIGALGEMLMVMKLAADGRPLVYLAASMWPAGFYPLIKQLLKQRKKHFSKQNAFKSD